MAQISKTNGTRWTRLVRASANADNSGVLIHEGERPKGSRLQYDTTCVFLTREEIAKLSAMFPVKQGEN